MDSGSTTAHGIDGAGGESPLEKLGEATGRNFPNLLAARNLTAERLRETREAIGELPSDSDASVVLMGSWGRAEITAGSDDDFMLLVDGPERDQVEPSINAIKQVLSNPPGDQRIFAQPVFCNDLVQKIGLNPDDNDNLSRRLLFLLESVPASNPAVHREARVRVLQHRYLDESIKDYRPPRFLLNDTVRYWRTICVDFAAKEYEGPEKWGIRNAKLRTSRKVLFAGGLLPIFECVNRKAAEMFDFIDAQLDLPPTDRIAQSFLNHDAIDAGGRALGAYDEFIGLLGDPEFRRELYELRRADADRSDAFQKACQLGLRLESGLLALLFETERLPQLTRAYGIF